MLLLLLEVDLYEQTVDHHHNGSCLIPWKKIKISSELQFLHHRHILLLHLHRFRPQVKILSFFHTNELQLRSLVSCVSPLCRDLVSVHIIYSYEWYLLPPPSSWHQRTGKTTRDYHYSNEYSILTRRPHAQYTTVRFFFFSLFLFLSLFLSLQKLRRNFRIKKKRTSAGALTMSVKTLASCMQRKKKKRGRMSATPVSTRSYTPRIDARTSMEHLLRRPSPGRRWHTVADAFDRSCAPTRRPPHLPCPQDLHVSENVSSCLFFILVFHLLPLFISLPFLHHHPSFFFRCIVPLSVHTLFIFLPFLHHSQFFIFLFHSPLLTHLRRVFEGSLEMKKGRMKDERGPWKRP